MFGTNFKSSIFVLPWLLLPLFVMAFFAVVVEPWIQENGYALRRELGAFSFRDVGKAVDDAIDEYEDEGLEYEDEMGEGEKTGKLIDDVVDGIEEALENEITVYRWLYASECFSLSTIIAIIANLLFLLIIPCALGGFDGGKKRVEFYIGFFINLAGLIALPLVYYLFYELDTTTFSILLGTHAVSFMATYIVGSRFVSPAYRKAFWFA